MGKLRWSHLAVALGAVLAVMIVSPALGGPSLRSLVKKEVAKQIAKATGPAGPAGTNGTNGTNGADGTARAYGRVGSTGVVTRSKNVTSVTHPSTGVYCITVGGGIDPSTTVLLPRPDGSGDATDPATEDMSVVEWASGEVGLGCPAGTLAAVTLVYNGDATDNDNAGVDTPGDDLVFDDEPFAFVVP
ncbi:MAG: hypothetical protein ACXWES_06460 [Solirubrobacterales bacterium]